MNISIEYLQRDRPVPDGWHFNMSTLEHHLYEKDEIIYTVTDIACQLTKQPPQWFYGVARGIIAP